MDYQTLHLLLKCGKEFGHRKIRPHGLSDTECLLCSYISFHPGCPQDEVVRALRMDKTTVAKALRNAERKALLRRERHPSDRRRNVLHITEEGAARISAIADLHDKWLTQVLSALTPAEQAQFEGYCLRLLRAAEALSQGEEAPDPDCEPME